MEKTAPGEPWKTLRVSRCPTVQTTVNYYLESGPNSEERSCARGLRWDGNFDLAAFYDTISYELLLRNIYPRTTNADLDELAA